MALVMMIENVLITVVVAIIIWKWLRIIDTNMYVVTEYEYNQLHGDWWWKYRQNLFDYSIFKQLTLFLANGFLNIYNNRAICNRLSITIYYHENNSVWHEIFVSIDFFSLGQRKKVYFFHWPILTWMIEANTKKKSYHYFVSHFIYFFEIFGGLWNSDPDTL